MDELTELCCQSARDAGLSNRQIKAGLKAARNHPSHSLDVPHFGPLARHLAQPPPVSMVTDEVDLLPNSQPGAGGHVGAVVHSRNYVIPSAVGSDIGCRMVLSILDLPPHALGRLAVQALHEHTRFGLKSSYSKPLRHSVMDRDWSAVAILNENRRLAAGELGTSGSGNHFVELGWLDLAEGAFEQLPAGRYTALLSHSGSRSMGRICFEKMRNLFGLYRNPDRRREGDLVYFELGSEPAALYLAAHELLMHYARAHHDLIHDQIVKALGGSVLAQLDRPHNFVQREGEMMVHRKGACYSRPGEIAIIAGSLSEPSLLVKSPGSASLPHGTGRQLSRAGAARERFDIYKLAKELGVHLSGGGAAESRTGKVGLGMDSRFLLSRNSLAMILTSVFSWTGFSFRSKWTSVGSSTSRPRAGSPLCTQFSRSPCLIHDRPAWIPFDSP